MRVSRLILMVLAFHFLAVSPRLLAQHPGPIPDGSLTSGKLSFDGHATVGDFVGATTTVSGQIQGGADVTAVKGWVEAPVQTLKTGNGKRDKDLNKSMESSKYPNIRFDLDGVRPTRGTPDSVAAILHGVFTIHGVTNSVGVPGTLQFHGREVRVRADVPLNLKDYRIGGLSKMLGVLKMHENIEVHVDVLFRLGPGS